MKAALAIISFGIVGTCLLALRRRYDARWFEHDLSEAYLNDRLGSINARLDNLETKAFKKPAPSKSTNGRQKS